MKKILVLLFLFGYFFSNILVAQEAIQTKYVEKTFQDVRLINTQTVENVPEKAFQFILQHRFGMADFKDDFFKNFFGLDETTNIRFGFAVPVSRRLLLGVGRTKFQKTFDFEGKYIILKQTKDDKVPVSVAFHENLYYRTSDYSGVDEALFKSSYRLSYSSQLIISRKFNGSFSLQINPTLLHRNLTEDYENNNTFILPVGGRIKTSLFSSVLFEYAFIFDKPGFDNDVLKVRNPISISYEYKKGQEIVPFFLSKKNN